MAITRAQQAKQLLALGGRIGLQEGGGIEQRLEQLGGDVTSAEQMLQGINKRLKTAESSLGSGGGIGGLQAVQPGEASLMNVSSVTRPSITDLKDNFKVGDVFSTIKPSNAQPVGPF